MRNLEAISQDGWVHDQAGMDRPGNKEIQLELFYSYGSNPALYPEWQEYFRAHQPPMLIVWGKNDQIFPAAGVEPTSAISSERPITIGEEQLHTSCIATTDSL